MIYYISDTHFYHEKIIERCKRPYANIKEMNEDIIRKWNNKIKSTDDVYFLGDFSLKCTLEESIALAKRLNGRKHFIKGNHDKIEFLEALKNEKIIEDYAVYKEIDDNDRKVVLFHYPIEDWNGLYKGSYHIFGHIHDSTNNCKKIPNRFNVSIEVIGYEPKSLDELIKIKQNQQYQDDFTK